MTTILSYAVDPAEEVFQIYLPIGHTIIGIEPDKLPALKYKMVIIGDNEAELKITSFVWYVVGEKMTEQNLHFVGMLQGKYLFSILPSALIV